MISASNDLKSQANTLFSHQDYTSAISTYDRALSELPNYLDYEMAVLQSNIAACHLRLEQWKDAVECCGRGLDGLEREMPTGQKEKNETKKNGGKTKTKSRTKRANGDGMGRINSDTESEDERLSPKDDEDDAVVELPSDADEEDEATALAALNLSDTRKADITRIRVKLLLRRARARTSLPPTSSFSDPPPASKSPSSSPSSTWTNLSSALSDYTLLQSTPQYWDSLPPGDRKTVRQALIELPPKIEAAKQNEVSEMMGKLKDLGNTVLKPFGLSTDMFNVTQGEGGGYSLSFDQGKKG
jgi:tetratricopeptide (TPR) repeat protein